MDLPRSSFPKLDHSDVLFLGKKVLKEEIKVALFDMALLKAPVLYKLVMKVIANRFKATSIPEFHKKVIMSAITNTTTQILWNGVLTQMFSSIRGIRQRANLEHAKIIKKILDNFRAFSRHRINAHKMNVFFSKRVDEDFGAQLCRVLNFRKVHNLGSNLGVILFHEMTTNNSLRFVVDKVKARLQW
ncbi:hypothetical protein PVK06_030577 [Gossypium arboreum]|uniref:Uncharacterized protein n=1 Tax=Gossypium arboreum TaxID=29729 RepID=A0ABR0NRV0_GOSAR|nr:hypothetical protein PVK06_030577 [Gossypium arboreum]